ncbi:acetylxylan esterase [Microbacterium stercoris]|uniref:acetylxylan esterase n=1 Tax=Microbacterium stercoris TaxID=2820289 RepID=UPI0027DE2A8C|nr:acetylxylan esterase [Microbacterium stercoris]
MSHGAQHARDPREAALERHVTPQTLPDDFAEFWRDTLAEARDLSWDPVVTPVETPLRTIDVFDVTFAGFGGEPIHAWLRLPAHRTGPLPAVIHFTGYGAGRGRAIDDLTWASAGYAHLVMDTRGQGDGTTPDGPFGDDTGYLVRGLTDPARTYYRRVFTDAALLVDVARRLPEVDAGRVALIGNSQGGAIALAAAYLSEGVLGVLAQSPFLADIPTALTLSARYPFQELTDLFARDHARRDPALATLRYVDVVNFARLAHTPAWLSCGLNDDIAPAATAYAVRNAYAADVQLTPWPANGHDAGGSDDRLGALSVLAELFAPAA